jgi:hypothetical protein
MANPFDFTRADAERLAAEIRRELPDAQVDNWRDYGFSVDVRLGDRACIACQPHIVFSGQPPIFTTAAEVKALLTGRPPKRA